MHASGGMAGPALTVRTRPGDNPMVRRALDMAEPGDIPGDIIVVDAGCDQSWVEASLRRLGCDIGD